MREWLTFRQPLTLAKVQAVFWVGVIVLFILGVVSKSGWQFLLVFFGGSFVWHLFCELYISFASLTR